MGTFRAFWSIDMRETYLEATGNVVVNSGCRAASSAVAAGSAPMERAI
jgi:hypothetical protein